MFRVPPLALALVVAASAHSADLREVAARDGANIQRPTWSPDGKKLSYEANFHDKKKIELYVGDPASGGFSRVMPTARGASAVTTGFSTKGTRGQVAHELSWSPVTMRTFVYAASNEAMDYDLYIGGASAVAAAPGADGGAAWSPDGRWIAFTSARTGQGDLYLLDVTAIEVAPKQLTEDPTASELFASWAPDSKTLAYVGHTSIGDNLWLMPAQRGATATQLTRWPGIQTHPVFSPDGARVAFYADRDGDERFDLFAVDVDGAAEPLLLVEDIVPNALGPRWTPDGNHVVFVKNDDARYDPICAVPVARPGAVQVLELGTVGHGDLDVTRTSDGTLRVAYVAQGRKMDAERSFKRLFVAPIPKLQ